MKNKMFTIGPVEMYPSTKTIRNEGIVHFRTAEYGNIVKNCLSRLSSHLGNNIENSFGNCCA